MVFYFSLHFDSPRIVRPSKGRGVARRGCSSWKHDQTMAAFSRSWKAARSEEIYALQVLAFRLDRPIGVAVCWVLQPWNSLFFFLFCVVWEVRDGPRTCFGLRRMPRKFWWCQWFCLLLGQVDMLHVFWASHHGILGCAGWRGNQDVQ